MLVFHTAGDPPSSGSTSLATIGWTMNTSAALVKTLTTKMGGVRTAGDAGTASIVSVMARIVW